MSRENQHYERKVRLLIRLDANDYPNRQDFLMRLAEINMLSGPLDLVQILGKSYWALNSMPADTLNLLQAGYVAAEYVPPRTSTPESKGLGKVARVCPECLNIDVPQHPHFNFSLPVPCRLHQIMPIDECPHCDMSLSYTRKRLNYCDCGFKLAAAPRVAVPEWLPRFFGQLLHWKKTIPPDTGYVELAERFSRSALVVRVLLTKYPISHKTISYQSWIKLRELLAMEKFMVDWTKSFDDLAVSIAEEATSRQRNEAYRVLLRYSGLPLKRVHREVGGVFRRSYRCDAEPVSSGEVSDFCA